MRATSSPTLTWWPGSRIVRPLIVTCPARMSVFRRERDRSFTNAASARSSRWPVSATPIVAVCTIGASDGAPIWVSTSPMSNPDLDEDEQLGPAQAQIVAGVRWLMLISGIATMLGIAVVVAVIGYRVFRTEGRPGAVEATAQLPTGARVVSTATAGDRIVVTIDIGGALEVRTVDATTLSPDALPPFLAHPP